MGKFVFEVYPNSNYSLPSLLKKVSKLQCRLSVNLSREYNNRNIIELYDIDDDSIDAAIDLISEYFTILNTEIDTTAEKLISNEEKGKDSENNSTEEIAAENVERSVSQQLVFEPVKFENEYIRGIVNKLLNTVFCIMQKQNISEKEIGGYIQSATTNIYLNYWGKEIEEFSIGDVVKCNLGTQLPGEVNGTFISAIVCDFLPPNMVYIVPLTKAVGNEVNSVRSFLNISASDYVTYPYDVQKNSTVLLDKGRYIRAERVRCVIGETKPEFFEKVLRKLSTTFDFTKYLEYPVVSSDVLGYPVKKENVSEVNDSVEKVYECEIVTDVERSSENKEEFDEETSEILCESEMGYTAVTENVVETGVSKENETEENVILSVIGESLEKLGVDELTTDKIEEFLSEIGMVTSTFVKQAILYACGAKKITYAGVLAELYLENSAAVPESKIKAILKDTFKKWINENPTVSEKYPRLSFVSFLKIFSRKFAKENENKQLTNQ